MDRVMLEHYLSRGRSLEQIGVLVNRHPSTVGYWMKKHGLVANGREKHASRGGLKREQLEPLIENGATLREMSEALGVSVASVRHWLGRFGLATRRRRHSRGNGRKPAVIEDECARHRLTEFVLEKRGAYRCKRCRSDSVSIWRRRVKRALIDELGGRCAICGYDQHLVRSTSITSTLPRSRLRSAIKVRPGRWQPPAKRLGSACCCARTATRRSKPVSWRCR